MNETLALRLEVVLYAAVSALALSPLRVCAAGSGFRHLLTEDPEYSVCLHCALLRL